MMSGGRWSDRTRSALVFVGLVLVTLGVLAWLILLWAQQDTERQRLVDLAEARGVPLSDARAARAATSGQGARLEERIKGSS